MARYVVDPGPSRLTVQAFAGGMLSAFGHNPKLAMRDLDGEAQFDPESPDKATLIFRVRPAKMEVLGDAKASDRRDIERAAREDVLETDRFPEVVFESPETNATKVGDGFFRAEMTGNLRLHGETRNLTIPSQLSVMGDMLRANGEVSLRQTDFGIRLYSAAGGTLKVKDEVKLTFEIVARRSAEE